MIRFISFLLGKPYETCKSCEILKQQLMISNEEKKELTKTLLNLLQPKVYEQVPQELQPSQPVLTTFSRRRAELERRDREAARTLKTSTAVGRPDDGSITKLEEELNIAVGEEE